VEQPVRPAACQPDRSSMRAGCHSRSRNRLCHGID
jgi:hypothetical protein